MSTVYSILTVIVLCAAVYAQWRIPFHTATIRHALITRLVLFVVGAAFGVTVATTYSAARGEFPVLAFLAGFGLVHVPAAAILFLKRWRAQTDFYAD